MDAPCWRLIRTALTRVTSTAEFVVGGPGFANRADRQPDDRQHRPRQRTLERPDIADTTFDMRPRIVPMRVDADFSIAGTGHRPARQEPCSDAMARKPALFSDVWVDRSDFIIRYMSKWNCKGTVGELME
jgi:hypothetical protein